MKNTKILFVLLTLVLVVALVACGGEKTPDVTEGPAATTTKAPAATTTQAPVATTTAAPVAPALPNTIEEYKSLYVADANVVHLNFAEATPDSEALVGNAYYEDETKPAGDRFTAVAANYIPYLFNTTIENPISGGTAKILTPWYFEDWYADWTVKVGSGSVADMRTTEPLKYEKTVTVAGTTVYVVNTTESVETEYYLQSGKWAKKTYASTWGDGYLHLGVNSTLSFAGAVTAAKGMADGSYTIQFIAQRVGNGSWDAFLGNRYTISSKNGVTISNNGATWYPDFQPVSVEGIDINSINGYTFTFDRKELANVVLGGYVNAVEAFSQTVAEKSSDGVNKIFESADSNVYAIRIYGKVLTAEEVLQNHFADLALICELDITEFLKLDDAKKASVYEAMKEYTYDLKDMKVLVQKALDEAIAAAK